MLTGDDADDLEGEDTDDDRHEAEGDADTSDDTGEDEAVRKLLTTLLAVHTPFGADTLESMDVNALTQVTQDVVRDELGDDTDDTGEDMDTDDGRATPSRPFPDDDRAFR